MRKKSPVASVIDLRQVAAANKVTRDAQFDATCKSMKACVDALELLAAATYRTANEILEHARTLADKCDSQNKGGTA